MKTARFGVCLVFYWCVTPVAIGDSLQTYLNPVDISVPPDPMSYFKESSEQKATWQRAKNV